MLTYKVGDITEAPEGIIAHGCNAQGVMRSGVAKAIREKWPMAYHEYMARHLKSGLQIGSIIAAYSRVDHKIIVNCITQDKFGYGGEQYVDYDAIRQCMTHLKSLVVIESIALPKIGAGLGGGDWAIIEQIIKEELDGVSVTIYVLDEKEIPKLD